MQGKIYKMATDTRMSMMPISSTENRKAKLQIYVRNIQIPGTGKAIKS